MLILRFRLSGVLGRGVVRVFRHGRVVGGIWDAKVAMMRRQTQDRDDDVPEMVMR